MPAAPSFVGPGGSRRYDSWFLSARSPDARRGVWLRRTVHVGREGRPHVAAWCTTYEATASTVKQLWAGGSAVRLLASSNRFAGVASGAGRIRPRRAPNDAEPVVPAAATSDEGRGACAGGAARGYLDVDGRRWRVDGWPATVGHNWAIEHAEQWLWLHALDLGAFCWSN